jgi:NitT/TauT family transport system permease protein
VTESSRQNPIRAEREIDLVDAGVIGDVERPLTVVERVANHEAVQRLTILVAIIIIWELYARWLNNALLFPTFTETVKTFSKDVANGVLVDRTLTSLRTLAIGYTFGVALATLLTTFAVQAALARASFPR